ncbi:MAG: AraC family transcriptional regulator ligand-binding domain-containing protein, partial [Polyangiaceae bacterium]
MSVSIIVLRALAEVVEQAGVGREQLLAGTGVSPAQLDSSDARVDFGVFSDVQARALDRTGDEALGLH